MLHKFRDHEIHPFTRILIVGTFHPNINNGTNFFHGTLNNYLWKILPFCFNEPDLMDSPLILKKEFMRKHRIDFVDIIASLQPGLQRDQMRYGDEFIDGQVGEWKNVEEIIDGLEHLEEVYFTRKSFGTVPNIEERVAGIRNHCVKKHIRFSLLETPSRFCNVGKIQDWRRTIIEKTICR